jgi:imidazolonepropionase-like amidohydrolase
MRRSDKKIITSFLVLSCIFLLKDSGISQNSSVFAVRDARVFDGERVLEKAVVVVKDGKILGVGAGIPIPEGANIIDGSGKTLLPGLIDSHTHISPGSLEQSLVFGVTTDIDMFMDVSYMKEVKKLQAEGKNTGRADLISPGTLVTAPGGHGTQYGLPIPTIKTPADAQVFVDARIAEGADFIKIIYGIVAPGQSVIDKDTLAAVIAAAHKRGKLAVVHVTQYKNAREAVEAGADGLAHIFPDERAGEDFVKIAARRRVFIIPTLTVINSILGIAVDDSFLNDSGLSPFLGPADISGLRQTFPASGSMRYENAEETLRMLKAAKIPILAGTDAPNPGTVYGVSLHRELELLVKAGLTPAEALAAATSLPASIFGLKDRGRIVAGLRADLILVEGNPLEDIKATRRIVSIWKGGALFDRTAYQKVIEKQKDDEKKRIKAAPAAGVEAGLISDFEDGRPSSKFGAGWGVSTDSYAGGKSKAEMKVVDEGANGSKRSLLVSGEVAPGLPYAWSGVAFFPGAMPFAPTDLSSKKELVFWARGDAKSCNVMLYLQDKGFMPVYVPLKLEKEWQEFVFPFADFAKTDGRNITGISIAAGPVPGMFTLQIDEVRIR